MKNLLTLLFFCLFLSNVQSQSDKIILESPVEFKERIEVTADDNSIFLGLDAGINIIEADADHNVFIGASAGRQTTVGVNNIFLGNNAGEQNISGNNNVFIGRQAGREATGTLANVMIGFNTGLNSQTGQNNVFIGMDTGYKNQTGTNNTYLGANAGKQNVSGLGNVFVGFNAGFNELGSSKLYIDNSATSDPLIKGDFTHDNLELNGQVHIRDFMKLNPGAAPTNPETGTIYYDSSDDKVKVWTGAGWDNLN